MEQYIALIPDDIKPGIVNPKIGDDVKFEINANFMRELRRKLFAGTDDEDAYEHGISNYTQGRALKLEKLGFPVGTLSLPWDSPLKKNFIWEILSHFNNCQEIRRNPQFFKQERDETLYHAWERYNDLLYQCPLHDLNCQQKLWEDEGDLDVPVGTLQCKTVRKVMQFLQLTHYTLLPYLEPVVQPYIPLGPVHDKDKIVREKEQDYDIPLNDSVM
ncbi:hypothetical protein Tco_0964234 [Tanacetum coccineum]